MNDREKLVSIILPIYNGEKYMRQSIESVINQTYKNWELIIIDDCSSDNTPTIAKEYTEKDSRIRYYRNETNLKLPRGLNRGFSLSKGEYLTWTSDDNLFLPTAIERMVGVLNNEKTDFVFAACYLINESGEVFETMKAQRDYKRRILESDVVGACFLYSRKVYLEIGEYNPDRFLVEDYDYWLRVFAKYNISNIQEVLYKYRCHEDSLTSAVKGDKRNRVCESVLLDNLPLYGKLSLIQKYYLYNQLNTLRQTRGIKNERNEFLLKYRLYKVLYFWGFRLPDKIYRIKNKMD